MNITKQTDPYKNNHHLSDRYKSSCSLAAFKEYGTLFIHIAFCIICLFVNHCKYPKHKMVLDKH